MSLREACLLFLLYAVSIFQAIEIGKQQVKCCECAKCWQAISVAEQAESVAERCLEIVKEGLGVR